MLNEDKLTKKILQFMAPKGADRFCSIDENWDYQADIPFGELCKMIGAEDGETIEAIEYMVRKNLAGYRTLNSKCGPVHTAFYLKHEGLNWKELKRNERNSYIIKSILVPILVSLLTSAIIAIASYTWTMAGIKTLNASSIPSPEPTIEETIDVPIG